MGRKGTLPLLVGMLTGLTFLKNNMDTSQKLRINLLCDTAITLMLKAFIQRAQNLSDD